MIAKVKFSIKNDKFPFQKLLCIIAPLETCSCGCQRVDFYDNDGDDSREEEDDDASDDSVCYVDHSYSISQRFFRTVRGFDLEVL